MEGEGTVRAEAGEAGDGGCSRRAEAWRHREALRLDLEEPGKDWYEVVMTWAFTLSKLGNLWDVVSKRVPESD